MLFVGLLDLFSLLFRASSEMKINKIERENKDTIRHQFNQYVCINRETQSYDEVDDIHFHKFNTEKLRRAHN